MGGVMSSIVVSGDTSGAITIAAPAVAGTNTLTLPAATGTVMVSGNMPVFSAYANTTQAISQNVNTLININAKKFDTNTCFNNAGSTVTLNGVSAPAYSFAPNVAGYYSVGVALNGTGTSSGLVCANLYKNGAIYQYGTQIPNSTIGVSTIGTFLVYLNGTSDYIQFYGYVTTGGTGTIYGDSTGQYTYFQASMVRTA